MPKKGKKKGGGKGKGKGKKKAEKAPEAPAPAPPPPPPVRKVIVNYEMFPGSAPWNFLDFSEIVFLKTRVFRLRDSIVDRHGGSIHRSDVSLYLNAASRRLHDELLTLEELTPPVLGFVEGEPEQEITIYYDFNPPQSDKNDGLDTSFSTLGPRLDQTAITDQSWTCPILLSDPVVVEPRIEYELDESGKASPSKDTSDRLDYSEMVKELQPAPLMHRPSTSLGFRPSTASSPLDLSQ